MSTYLLFHSAPEMHEGQPSDPMNDVLVEIDDDVDLDDERSVRSKAGLSEVINTTVVRATISLQEALQRTIQSNVYALRNAVKSLEEPPNEMEISFGLKVTAEASNVAVGKIGGEANYTVKLTWKA
ncbi:hypothetical protein CCAX7_35800 [Capsulimonas corticalis]|uniref:Trypsin-co-occurring domain-containing protein n=1 Tax=Capsulimonas corticalis TaxID=2219043 RepID=A0A402D688_9BACT|nr:CU044_2847 family protein [Capsulimonas corticalis]BDI31529.1 hypothetical protein CCAX7_35800 [Capsulimonas corticalis]